jgi:glycosyltransferase involved in cell wall biosynthesis
MANRHRITKMYEYEGVTVYPPERDLTDNLLRWADVVCTHLDYTQWTIHAAGIYRKPVIHFIHNTWKYLDIADATRKQYIVYNSEWAKKELGYKWPSFVLYPPCDWRQYDTGADTEKNKYITLINLDKNKGGHILGEIATRMPEYKFIGVKGSYSEPASEGQQVDQPSNVWVQEKTTNIKAVYENTRILIMPSKYESWGRTATEAMCSGIPVISSGTPGLRENCGDAGIYVDREDIDGWIKAIKALDKPAAYKRASKAAKERSRELDPVEQLKGLEEFITFVRHDSLKTAGVSTLAY